MNLQTISGCWSIAKEATNAVARNADGIVDTAVSLVGIGYAIATAMEGKRLKAVAIGLPAALLLLRTAQDMSVLAQYNRQNPQCKI